MQSEEQLSLFRSTSEALLKNSISRTSMSPPSNSFAKSIISSKQESLKKIGIDLSNRKTFIREKMKPVKQDTDFKESRDTKVTHFISPNKNYSHKTLRKHLNDLDG